MAERFGPPMAGSDQISVWLFVVDPGHMRVFSAVEIGNLIDLDTFNKADSLDFETQEERERLAGLRIRFISTTIVPERRLKIPSDAFDVCGEYLDRSCVWLEETASYLDVYTATYVQKVLAIHPSKFLPPTFPTK
jgi:hypothetical protein